MCEKKPDLCVFLTSKYAICLHDFNTSGQYNDCIKQRIIIVNDIPVILKYAR